MRVCVTGDFHGREPPDVPDCDLLLFAGDLGMHIEVFETYIGWLVDLAGRNIPAVGVAGNRDFNSGFFNALPWYYLENDSVTVAGKKIWGSPLSRPFMNWAHMKPESELEKVYATIPDDVDIIISHGPPFGYGDHASQGSRVGSEALMTRALELPNLKLIACGHIHEGYGAYRVIGRLGENVHEERFIVVNGSWLNAFYDPGNPPIVVEL